METQNGPCGGGEWGFRFGRDRGGATGTPWAKAKPGAE